MKIKSLLHLFIFFLLLSLPMGCSPKSNGYKRVEVPKSQVKSDILYSTAPDADPDKNRLNLFIPQQQNNWPVLIFVHGGNWSSGDKDLVVFGEDVYSNIGRFFASEGIGVAVINYRLMPKVDWKTQVLDVARAVAWVKNNISTYGGNPQAIFISGHSAGAQLATRVALDPEPLQHFGYSPQTISGVISISGAGFDLTDEETYDLAKKEKIFEKVFFSKTISPTMRRKLSPIQYVNKKAPPFLIAYAEFDPKEIKEESKRLHAALSEVGVYNHLIEVPETAHRPIVLEMSNPNKSLSRNIESFIKSFSHRRGVKAKVHH